MNFQFETNIQDLQRDNQVSDITPEKIEIWKKAIYEILDKSHSSFNKKEIFLYPNRLNPDRINFSCPICGDSQKNERKRRGNIYLESLTYHCFNDDCLSHMNLNSFFERFGYKNLLDSGDLNRIHSFSTIEKKDIDLNAFSELKYLLFTREELKNKLNFSEIEENSFLDIYLKKRYQLNKSLFLEEKSTGNLIILNCDKSGNFILSFQIRTMKEKTKTENKYLTFSYYKVCSLINKEYNEEMKKIDSISQYFGILNINFNKWINIFEGPLDSFLLPNSIGLCSLNNSFNIKMKKRFICDDDIPGRKKALDYLNKNEYVFLWKKIKNDLIIPHKEKWDWNDLVIWCIENNKQIDILKYISNNMFDAIWI